VPDHDSTNGRRGYELNALIHILYSNRSPESGSILRKLQHERALQIDRTVQAAGKLEMTFEQRSSRFELIDNLFRLQIPTSLMFSVLQSRSNAALSEFSF
jgi:hypothetical protein